MALDGWGRSLAIQPPSWATGPASECCCSPGRCGDLHQACGLPHRPCAELMVRTPEPTHECPLCGPEASHLHRCHPCTVQGHLWVSSGPSAPPLAGPLQRVMQRRFLVTALAWVRASVLVCTQVCVCVLTCARTTWGHGDGVAPGRTTECAKQFQTALVKQTTMTVFGKAFFPFSLGIRIIR